MRPPARNYRPDIEGLRAVAVISVVLYHAGVGWMRGGFVGVDVFFVISGYLITTLMLREVEREGRLRLGEFWARRARRLLPASTFVLLFCGAITVLWLPLTSHKVFGGDMLAAALYVVNWRLGYRQVDYLAEGVGSSPVQHYWSLGVEEQFYLLWPLLMVVAAVLFAKWRRWAFAGVVLAVSVASFAWAVHYSVEQPGLAFFVTTTRLWEIGVGALLAIAWPLVRRTPPVLRACLGWAGLAAILTAVLRYDGAMTWPGTATLLPVLGTVAVIASGGDGMELRRGVERVIGIGPMVAIGALSYSIYLWHWPFLVAAKGIWGEDLSVGRALVVVLVSVVPAWLSYRLVENPVRHDPRFATVRTAFRLSASGTVIAGLAGAAVIGSVLFAPHVDLAPAKDSPGASSLAEDQPPGKQSGKQSGRPKAPETDWAKVESVPRMRPTPLHAADDLPRIYQTDCVVGLSEDAYEACVYGDRSARRTVVLVGDSKAMQWFTPVDAIARRSSWRLVVIGKNGCEFADVVRADGGVPNKSCDRWSGWALDKVRALHPSVVLTVTHWTSAQRPGSSPHTPMTGQALVDGLVRQWRSVLATGAQVVPILDTPGPPHDTQIDCVLQHQHHLTACGYPLAPSLSASGAPEQRAAAARVPQVHPIDMTDLVCPDGTTCPAVIGNVLVYRTGTHLTDSYSSTTQAELGRRIAEATGGRFGKP